MTGRERAAESGGSDLAACRRRMFTIAYRMLSSVADAEDVVQEAFLRFERAARREPTIESPAAYLAAVTTRLAIDHLRSARRRRETYVGEWLPEPLLTDPGPDGRLEREEEVSMAFLLALERLSPVERAVFLLRDVFDYGYAQIAEIVQKSVANCRQLARRARRRIEAGRSRYPVPSRRRTELASRFFAAVRAGEPAKLARVLAADVAVHGDGGGRAPQWARPIVGRTAVAKLLGGFAAQLSLLGIVIDEVAVNGCPGAVFRDRGGRTISVFALEVGRDGVETVYSVINPDKLRHLGPVADAWALQREALDAGRRRLKSLASGGDH